MTTGNTAGALAARLALDTSGFTANMQAAGALSEKELARIRRQVQFATDYIRELGRQQRVVNDTANMSRAAAEVAKVGQAAQISAAQLASANRMLPAQITDIFTSLASGQQPWLVLIQQGGQIKDMYGGIGNAVRQMAAVISPTSVLLTGLGVAAVGAGTAMYQGYQESNRLRDGLALTGNAAGLTADRFASMADRVTRMSAQTVGGTKEILFALAESGRSSFGVIESQARAAARIADLSGDKGAKAAALFAEQLKAPTKVAAQLNESYNFLNIAQFRRIQQLEKENRQVEAAVLTNDLLTKAYEGQRQNLGYLETALESASKKWSDFWNAVKGLGREDSTGEKLASARKQIDAILASTGGKEPAAGTYSSGRIQALRMQAMFLAEQAKQEQAAAEATAKAAEANKKAIEKAMEKPKAEPKGLKMFMGPPTFDEQFPPANVSELMQSQRDNQNSMRQFLAAERAAYAQLEADEQRRRLEEMQRMEEDAKKIIAERARHGQQQVQLFEDRVMLLVKNGKDGFRDLFAYMAEEYIRNLVRMAAQRHLLDSNGGFVGWGKGLGSMWSAAMSWFGGNATGHAQGLDYVPYDGYPAILHKGERVQTAVEAAQGRRAGGDVFQIDGSIGSVGAGVSRPEMDATLARRNAELEARFRRLAREGVFSA